MTNRNIHGNLDNFHMILGAIACSLYHFLLIPSSFAKHFVGVFQGKRLGRPGTSQGDLISGQVDNWPPRFCSTFADRTLSFCMSSMACSSISRASAVCSWTTSIALARTCCSSCSCKRRSCSKISCKLGVGACATKPAPPRSRSMAACSWVSSWLGGNDGVVG